MRALTRIGAHALCRVRMRVTHWHLRRLDVAIALLDEPPRRPTVGDLDDRVRQLRLEALSIRRARSAYLLLRLSRDDKRHRASRASLVYRKQARIDCKN